MKKFLSLESFKELKVLFIIEVIMTVLLTLLIIVNKSDIKCWNWKAFAISIGIWCLSSILATLLGTGFIMYLLWWFIFWVR